MKSRKYLIFALILTIIIIVIQFIAGVFMWKYISPENRGVFGDMFGAVNTLFSGLAFGGVIYTIILQMKELELTRAEYARSTEELKRSSDALKEQINITIKDQKTRSQGDLIKELFDDSELRKFFYKIDYEKFHFSTNKEFLENFKGSDDERRLDSLLFKYNYVGKLVRNKYLDIDDINFLIFPMLQVYNNIDVKRYLDWLDSENIRWGNQNYIRHGDYRWLMELSLLKVK